MSNTCRGKLARHLLFLLMAWQSAALQAFSPPSRLEVFYDYLKKTASETVKFNEEITSSWYEKLQNLQVKENLQKSYEQVKNMFDEDENAHQQKHQKAQNRYFLEKLGDFKISDDGRSLNDYARDAITRLRPDLQNSDFFNNPSKTISYFIVLDPRGFVENVKIIKGPMDTQMTIREAYQYYTRTDPKKAEKILNMLESLQKLNTPDSDQNQLQIILESVENTVELLNDSE